MSERRLTKEIYVAEVSGHARRERLIGEVLQKGQVRSIRDRRACMTRCINVYEAKGVCKDCSMWRSGVSAYPHWK